MTVEATHDWATAPPAPPGGGVPAGGECHLWPVPVLAPGADEAGWLALLTPDERERVERFRADHARRIFITSRAAQRLVGAHYTGETPVRTTIDRHCQRCGTGDHGRPRVRGAGALDVSVTHAGDWVLLAAVGTGAVGVDLEPHGRTPAAIDDLARAVFTPPERAHFDGLGTGDRQAWFYRCWTRKEAAAKLTGHGLAASFRHLDVRGQRAVPDPPPPGWPPAPVLLADVPAPPGYAAAVATTTRVSGTVLYTVAGPR